MDGILRPCPWAGVALLVLALASPALIRAQFQQPTDEELKMTADPKAPGAAAVYLYREEVTDAPHRYRSIYERIKVLTEKGKELATVSIPYEPGADKVTDVQGRTIHADGTVIPFVTKPDDLMDFKTADFQANSVVFNLPDVEVGSILEYRLRIRYTYIPPPPTWWIQQKDFVHRAHYSFRNYNYTGLLYATRIGSGAKVVKDKHDVFTLDIENVPPQPKEDWMPPLNTLRWSVEFYYSRFGSGKDFWDLASKRWADSVRDFTNPSGYLKKMVAEIVAPTDTDEQKAVKIYTAVQKLENTSFTRRKSLAERQKDKLKDINKAEDVWKQQSGTDDDIALLYVALARAAGLDAVPMKVVDRSRAFFDNTFLSTGQLDDFIVVVQLGGKEVYLDPGQKMCPFGLLSWKHAMATGFRLSGKTAVIATTPPETYHDTFVQRVASLKIDPSGGVKGTVRFMMTGQEALYWRQLALENDEAEVKKQFNESMRNYLPEGVQAEFDHFLALDDYSSNLVGIVQVSGTLGTVTGKHLFLPALFFESRAKHPFVALDKRAIPVDVHFPKVEQDDVTYYLPPGFNVESTPQPTNVAWPDHAMLKIGFSAKDGSAKVGRALAYNFTVLDPKDYTDLHDFYQKVATADQQQLVLTRAPAAKGN
jgi:hypothetical protein